MRAGVLMIVGSVVFFLGVAIAVPRVFTEPDRDTKLRMLERGRLWWRLGQPFCAGGALLGGPGGRFPGGRGRGAPGTNLLWVSCALLVAGAISWSWSVYLRAQHHRDFALGRLPGWPFATYCWLTLAGLALLGAGLLEQGPRWLGWVVLGADALYVLAYVRYRDLPPFVFYLLLSIVGVALLLSQCLGAW